ncbi:MAG TPA: hypothetical protein VGQ11_07995, partial [Candidatus Acidoferrales bacterium]|nr:hypothetical protein [Candidatus Acidoferrales bacterium]
MKRLMDCTFSRRILCALYASVVSVLAAPAAATIRYDVSVAEPEKHTFRVKITVPDVKDELTVQLPAWNALYQVRDFAYRVQNVRARDASDAALVVVKLDKQTWQTHARGTVSIEYSIYWDDGGPFSTQLNAS